MGEDRDIVFQAGFNGSVKIEVSPVPLTQDAGAILVREVAEKLDFTIGLKDIVDSRMASRVTHPLVELVRTRVQLIAQGRTDQSDATALRDDPAIRVSVSERTGERPLRPAVGPREPEGLASQPTLSRMQSMLGSEWNRGILKSNLLHLAIQRMRQAHGRRKTIIVDVDSLPMEAHGAQDGAAYNGHYRMVCFHPLIAFTDTGDLVGIMLRPGNVHTAKDVRHFLQPIIDTLKQECENLWIRMDAGYASGKLFAWLRYKGVQFVSRLAPNDALRKRAAAWETETAARWSSHPTDDGKLREDSYEFWHQVKGWTNRERIVAVMVERDVGKTELFHHVFYLVTSARRPLRTSRQILETYRQRGTAEGHIGEFKDVLAPTLSSAWRSREGAPNRKRRVGMAENEVSLILAAMAYELMHAARCLLEKGYGEGLSLRRFRERVLKTAANMVFHGRSIWFRICPTNVPYWAKLAQMLPSLETTDADVSDAMAGVLA
jgi:hypothetical protein